MKDYLKKLKKLVKIHGKAKVAVELGIKNTTTIDQWFNREMIPSKYLDLIKEMN